MLALRALSPKACYALTGGPQWPSSPTSWFGETSGKFVLSFRMPPRIPAIRRVRPEAARQTMWPTRGG